MAESLRIEYLTQDYLDGAAEVASLAYNEEDFEWARHDFALTFTNYPYKPQTFIALKEDRVVGVVQTVFCISWKVYSIAWLAVHPDHQRQGIAKALMEKAESYVRNQELKNQKGTIFLLNGHKEEYYNKLGYTDNAVSHAGNKFLVKVVNENRSTDN